MPRTKGILMVSGGALLWGVSGTVAQHLFQQVQLPADWLVTLRLLVLGVLFLLVTRRTEREGIWRLWLDSRFALQMLLFGVLAWRAIHIFRGH